MVNQPPEIDIHNPAQYYLNGPIFIPDNNNGSMKVPYRKTFSPDCTVSHARNAIIKNELFFCVN